MLEFGMPAGFQDALNTKYALLAQDSAARANAANAEANINNTRAGLLPAESAANIGLTGAQAGLARANTANVNENTQYVAPLARASIFNTTAQGQVARQTAIGEYQLNRLSGTLPGAGYGPGGGLPQFDDGFDGRLKSILREGMGYGN